jgi:hypothetical protein
MMENINDYLIVTACSLLLFLLVFLLLERYKKNIRASLEKDSWFSRKISRNVVIKIGLAWVCILLLRKLIYYVPLQGVIQTKLSVWWVDIPVLIITYCVFIGIPLVKFIRIIWQSSEEGASLMKILIPLFLFAFFNFISNESITIGRIFSTIIVAPFLLLKIVCPGKYIGLFTSLVLAYFVIEYHKKIRSRSRIFIYVLILLVLGAYIFLTFPGQWEDRFQQKAQTAKSKRAVEDLLDAVNTISHEEQRSEAIGIIAVKILETGDPQWQKETFPGVIAAVEKIDSRNRKFKLLEKIAFTAAETGDIQWAKSVVERLPAFDKRTRELKKGILGKIERKND